MKYEKERKKKRQTNRPTEKHSFQFLSILHPHHTHVSQQCLQSRLRPSASSLSSAVVPFFFLAFSFDRRFFVCVIANPIVLVSFVSWHGPIPPDLYRAAEYSVHQRKRERKRGERERARAFRAELNHEHLFTISGLPANIERCNVVNYGFIGERKKHNRRRSRYEIRTAQCRSDGWRS